MAQGGEQVWAWIAAGRAAARTVLDTILPPQCLICTTVVDAPGRVCAACFGRVTFITPPFCGVCGIPLDPTVTDDLICGACVAVRPVYERGRAVFVYDDESRSLVLKLKHGDRTDMAVHLAQWMHRAGREVLAEADVLIPVPLHRRRLLMRTYNQSALLARALGRMADKPVLPDALLRVKPTVSQGGLNRAARHRNVAKAFAVQAQAGLEDRHVLLIDDVLTSGATANACARALLEAGARRVDVLALGRVPLPG